MNCNEAKTINIVSFLGKIGFTGKLKNSFLWYCSPFRDEKTESFRVDPGLNRWVDFATMQKGDIVDLVKLIYKTDTQGALNILNNVSPDQSFSFSKANSNTVGKEAGIKINHVQPIINKALIQYLEERRIPMNIAMRYTNEVYYTSNNKKFFSIGFSNDKGGYELRNKYFKNCSSPKYFTSFNVPGEKVFNIFEGFFDFLSALVYYKIEVLPGNTIVLNSLSNLPAALPFLHRCEIIKSYLDNDKPGIEAVGLIRSQGLNIENFADIIYPEYKDFNEYLINT